MYGRRRRGASFGRIARIARRVTGHVEAKRVNCDKLTIPDISAADYDNPLSVQLLTCSEAQDEVLESNGSDVATVPLYSKLLGMKLRGFIRSAGTGTEQVRWILLNNKDADFSAATIMSSWHQSDESSTARELRKITLAKGVWSINANVQMPISIPIRRAALKRNQLMREGDILNLVMAKDATGTTVPFTLWGTIWVATR